MKRFDKQYNEAEKNTLQILIGVLRNFNKVFYLLF